MRLVLFDIDGTLIGGRMGSTAIKKTFWDVFRVDAQNHAGIKGLIYNGRSDFAILGEMVQRLGIEAGAFEDAKDRFLSLYFENLETTIRDSKDKHVLPGVHDLLPRLQDHSGMTLGLLTGNLERGARIKLDDFGLSDYFPFGGFGEDGLDRKDIAWAAYRRGCEHAGGDVARERVLVVGDTPNDVAAAKAHGFLAAGVSTGGVACSELFASGADFCCETLETGFMERLSAWVDA